MNNPIDIAQAIIDRIFEIKERIDIKQVVFADEDLKPVSLIPPFCLVLIEPGEGAYTVESGHAFNISFTVKVLIRLAQAKTALEAYKDAMHKAVIVISKLVGEEYILKNSVTRLQQTLIPIEVLELSKQSTTLVLNFTYKIDYLNEN